LALPDTVSVAVGRLADELEEGLLAFAVGAGLQVLSVILDAEATALVGEKGRHDPERTAVCHDNDGGSDWYPTGVGISDAERAAVSRILHD